jgi:N-acyl-D-amino-acid deacylase
MQRAAIPMAVVMAWLASVEGQTRSTATLLVRNGRVIDGTGGPSRQVDVRVSGDTIVEVAPNLVAGSGEQVVDATGRVVSPGFVDVHSHADGGLVDHPDVTSQVQQGITTALVGQDGGGDLPVSDFLERMEAARPAINIATSVGHGTVRSLVLGADFKRAATDSEIAVMRALVERGMKDGAVGLSSGLEYDPGFYAQPAELAALASAIRPFGGVYSSHVRDEENDVVAAWREAIEVGRRAGVVVEISHMKVASKAVWGHAREALAVVDQAVRDGIDVGGDWYPYPYWQSSMYVLIPDRDFENVDKWRVGLDEIGGAGNVLITDYKSDPTWNGRTLAELAEQERIDPPALIVRMVKAAGPGIGIIGTSMEEADMRAIFSHPRVVICSDGQLSGRHPRGYNAFPRVLARYVRETPLVPLEEAIAKMTGRSAARLGLSDRGVIEVGRKADLVVFDPAAIADRGTPQQPSLSPIGIDAVVVNGTIVLSNGAPTGARPGHALRPKRKPASAASWHIGPRRFVSGA